MIAADLGSAGDRLTSGQITGEDAALAAVTLVAAWIVGRLARRGVLKVLERVQGVSEDLRQLAGRLTKYVVWLLGVGIALSFLGASIQPLLAAAIIVAVVAVLVLRGIADNFSAGVVLQTRRPIQLGDRIEVLGFTGTVIEMNGRSVVLETLDGKTVHVPNAKVLENPVVNTTTHASRRSDIQVRAHSTGGVGDVLHAIERAVSSIDALEGAPPPSVVVTEIDSQRITTLVHFWHATTNGAAAGSEAVTSIATALRSAGIDATVVTPPPPPAVPPPSTV